jgi:hypothetical protein
VDWVYDDGGRAEARIRTRARSDCAVRAIAIAVQKPYREVYEALSAAMCAHAMTAAYSGGAEASEVYRRQAKGGFNVARGCPDEVARAYLEGFGWFYTPAKNRRVPLLQYDLPAGRIIVAVHRHFVAVIDGVIHDTGDIARLRCVHGYYAKHTLGQGFRLVG